MALGILICFEEIFKMFFFLLFSFDNFWTHSRDKYQFQKYVRINILIVNTVCIDSMRKHSLTLTLLCFYFSFLITAASCLTTTIYGLKCIIGVTVRSSYLESDCLKDEISWIDIYCPSLLTSNGLDTTSTRTWCGCAHTFTTTMDKGSDVLLSVLKLISCPAHDQKIA